MDIKPGNIIMKKDDEYGRFLVEQVLDDRTEPYWEADLMIPSYSFICRWAAEPSRRTQYYLNHYYQDGDRYKGVFADKEILVVGQGDLSQIPSYKKNHGQLRLF